MRIERILTQAEVLELPLSTLAYIGDAVYELAVRRHLMEGCHADSGKLYVKSLAYVEASAQSEALQAILDDLNESESSLCRRARNQAPHSKPRNADLADYRLATALEALLGWHWLQGNEERTEQIIHLCFNFVEKKEGKA